ncbi:hypothetical protein SCHPADRAFT_936782 [Schizopora paradoxa]|uniref:Uncharacterized protein n=1 Tax=Schizopora paradoxa TaxID=27342 RepID=A0A0H2SKY8_9AGAM|nr:hypothetical protein SCHPADRAFT_936782 [Schizopora paradoxa]
MASSSGKKVSNATLGLRFMQNALRAKQQEQLDFEQAKVKDEAEWEIDPKVRETWGGPKQQIQQTSVSCEPSYLPFLFPSLQSTEQISQESSEGSSSSSSRLLRGRRKFNKAGEEVPLVDEPPKQPEDSKESSTPESSPGRRPISVSGFGGTKGHHKKPDSKGRKDAPAGVSVLKMLSSETPQSVGQDLRSHRASAIQAKSPSDEKNEDVKARSDNIRKVELDILRAAPSSSSGSSKQAGNLGSKPSRPTFMRPAGVDSPTTKPRTVVEKRVRPAEDESASGTPGDSGRRKKKKKNGGSNTNSDGVKSLGET